MEGTYDIPNNNKKSTFLHDYWTKSDGVLAELQIISYIFIILKHIQVSSQFRKLLMLKVWLSFFFWDNLYITETQNEAKFIQIQMKPYAFWGCNSVHATEYDI